MVPPARPVIKATIPQKPQTTPMNQLKTYSKSVFFMKKHVNITNRAGFKGGHHGASIKHKHNPQIFYYNIYFSQIERTQFVF
jgi:hypothetical protein